MTIKLTKLVDLQGLSSKVKTQRLSVKLMYKLSKFFAAVDPEVEFYRTRLNEIIELYAERDENGNPVPTDNGTGVKIQQDKLEECQKELDELLALEVEFPDIKFTLEEIEPLNLSFEEFNLLLPFLEE